LKLLIITNSSWNIYNFRVPLIRHFQVQGWEVQVIAAKDEYTPKLKEEFGIGVITLKNGASLRKGPQNWWSLYREMRQQVEELQPDCILSFTLVPNILAGFVSKQLRIPFIPTLTGLGYTFLHSSFTRYFVSLFYKKAFQKAHKVAFHNPDDLHFFLQKGIIRKEQGTVVPGSGIDLQNFQPITRTAPPMRKLVFVGRLLHDKGLVELVEACKRLWKQGRDFNLDLIGESDPGNPAAIDEKILDQWANIENLQLVGKVEAINPRLQAADIFVLPSYREGLPMSTLEAMAMALPIITTDTPGCRSTLWEGENGWLVPPKDISALEKAIKRALELPYSSLEKMGQQSRRLVQSNFSLKSVLSSYQQMISPLFETASHDSQKSGA
jgi:glycosyltransferase involved in cell wall biosynthesis